MARIFFHTDTGNIYGVHDGPFSGALPVDIDFIDVPETPDQILWPVNADGDSGEQFARVQGGLLVARDRPDLDAIDAATVDRLLLESGVTRAEIKTLFDHENRIRVLEGRPEVTVEQLKTAFRALIRS